MKLLSGPEPFPMKLSAFADINTQQQAKVVQGVRWNIVPGKLD